MKKCYFRKNGVLSGKWEKRRTHTNLLLLCVECFVPEKLFWNCKKVEEFTYTFSYCIWLTGKVPPELLKDKPELTTIAGLCSYMGNGWGTEAVGIGLVAQSDGQLIPERLLWEAPNLKNAKLVIMIVL